ncbi:MAG: hypothetical protein ACRD0A_06770 [Acidimicrobiales bacterium]
MAAEQVVQEDPVVIDEPLQLILGRKDRAAKRDGVGTTATVAERENPS